MPRRKIEPYPILDEWLEEIVRNLWEAKSKGAKPVLSQLLESLINAIMPIVRSFSARKTKLG